MQNNPIVQSHSREITTLRNANCALTRKVQQLTIEQSRMKKQLVRLENRNLDRSLIFRGIVEDYKETEEQMRYKLHCILSVIMHGGDADERMANARKITINSCRRLGRYNRNRRRPITVEMYHKQDCEYILDHRSDLDRGIYVDKEYPIDIERKRRTLLPILRAAKRLPDYKNQCRLEEDRLILKGKPFTIFTLNQLPEELNVFKVTTREDQNTIVYFGELNPLSNFYPAPFAVDNVNYISSEQYIQASKAKYFNDHECYEKILSCNSSIECKDTSRQIRNVDETKWEEVAGRLCYPGIRAKFEQNMEPLDTLVLKTGNKRIAEGTTEKLWGNGYSLGDPMCLDSTRWTTQGLMGQILEDIRKEFQNMERYRYRYQPAVIVETLSEMAQSVESFPAHTSTVTPPITTNSPEPTPSLPIENTMASVSTNSPTGDNEDATNVVTHMDTATNEQDAT